MTSTDRPFRIMLVAKAREHAGRPFPCLVALPYEGPPRPRYEFQDRYEPRDQYAYEARCWGALKVARDFVRRAAFAL